MAYSYSYITTAAANLIKTGQGVLHSITVNKTPAGIITIKDGVSVAGATFGVITPVVNAQTYTYDVAFSKGLTIINAEAEDITVAFS